MEERYELFCALTTKISRSIKKIKNLETEEFDIPVNQVIWADPEEA